MSVTNFLAEKFDEGLSYSTLCGYRSAISSFHNELQGTKIGNHPLVCRFLMGVFNERPPVRELLPKWDLEKVLKRLRLAPFEPLHTVPIKFLTYKTVFLVALASAGRSSDLTKLGFKMPYYREELNPKGIRFIPRSLRKQDRPGHAFLDIFIPAFTDDRKLDPVRAVKLYIKRMTSLRKDKDSLFITFGAGTQGRPASAQTIARWIVNVLSICGEVHKKDAKAHSTRSASTSAALFRGVSIANILRAADWSSESTFAHHYLKEHRELEAQFGRAVLGGSA